MKKQFQDMLNSDGAMKRSRAAMLPRSNSSFQIGGAR
jgi:hypothetical protein